MSYAYNSKRIKECTSSGVPPPVRMCQRQDSNLHAALIVSCAFLTSPPVIICASTNSATLTCCRSFPTVRLISASATITSGGFVRCPTSGYRSVHRYRKGHMPFIDNLITTYRLLCQTIFIFFNCFIFFILFLTF